MLYCQFIHFREEETQNYQTRRKAQQLKAGRKVKTRTKVVHKNVRQGQTSYHEKFASLSCYHSFQILIRSDYKRKRYLRKSVFLDKKVALI